MSDEVQAAFFFLFFFFFCLFGLGFLGLFVVVFVVVFLFVCFFVVVAVLKRFGFVSLFKRSFVCFAWFIFPFVFA